VQRVVDPRDDYIVCPIIIAGYAITDFGGENYFIPPVLNKLSDSFFRESVPACGIEQGYTVFQSGCQKVFRVVIANLGAADVPGAET